MAAIDANARLQSIILYVGQMENRTPRNEIVAAGSFWDTTTPFTFIHINAQSQGFHSALCYTRSG
jgi:hypothetical protein